MGVVEIIIMSLVFASLIGCFIYSLAANNQK